MARMLGIGRLADDVVERAFERFVSLDRRGGSGLGLPIARSLARSHGGELTYEDGAFLVRLALGSEPRGAQPDGAVLRSRV
jgi:signal transduction histidine kinase